MLSNRGKKKKELFVQILSEILRNHLDYELEKDLMLSYLFVRVLLISFYCEKKEVMLSNKRECYYLFILFYLIII